MQGALIPIPAILLRFDPSSHAHIQLRNNSVPINIQNLTSLSPLELEEQSSNMDKNVIQFQLTENFTDEKNLQLPKLEKNSLKLKGIDQINESLGKLNGTDRKNKISRKQPKFKEIETWNQSVEATYYDGTSDVNLTTTTTTVFVISATTTENFNPATKTVDVNPTTTTDNVISATTTGNFNLAPKTVDVNPTTTTDNVISATTTGNFNPATKTVDVNPTWSTTDNVNSNNPNSSLSERNLVWAITIIAILVFAFGVFSSVTCFWKKRTAALNLQKKTHDDGETENGIGNAQESENASLLPNGNNNPASIPSDGNNVKDELQKW